jgi:hypothetical protein
VAVTTDPITIDAALDAEFGTVVSDTLTVHPIMLMVSPPPGVTLSATGTTTVTDNTVMVGGGGTNDTGAPVTITLEMVDAGDHGIPCLAATVDASVSIAAGSGTSGIYTVTDTNGASTVTCQVKATLTFNGVDAINYSALITLDP